MKEELLMKRLSDEQVELLELVPQDFKGSQGEKLVYGAFISRNYEALVKGDKTFPFSFSLLEEKTGLKRARLSKIVNTFVLNKLIGEVEGKEKKGKCRTYYTFHVPERNFFESRHQNSKVDTKSRHHEDEKVDTTYTYTSTYTNTKDQSVLGSGRIGPDIKEYLDLLSVEIRKELACAYEERISKLEERLNKASKYTKDLEDTLRKVVDQVNSLTKRVRELEGKHTNSVDQGNNTNVGTQEVGYKSNPNSDSEVDKLIDTLKEGSKTHSASELTGAADKLQSLIDNKALMGQPSKFGLAVNLIRETKSKYKTSTVSDSKSTKRMSINRKEPTENPAEYSKLYKLHSLISDHKSVDQRIGVEYFNLIAKCKELDAAGLITSIDSNYFKSWCKPTDPEYQKCLQAVKGSNELSPSVPLAPLSEEISILVAE